MTRTSKTPRTLGELEKTVYESRWEDGLLDLLGALGVMFVGWSWEAEIPWAGPMLVPVLLIAWTVLRNSLVESRTGRVTFSRDRREKERQGTRLTALLGSGLLFLILAGGLFTGRAAQGPSQWLQVWIAALPTALLALMALIAAALLGLRRFLIYAVILLAAGAISTPLGVEPGVQILLAGALIFFSGLIVFFRFLSDHSVLRDLEGIE